MDFVADPVSAAVGLVNGIGGLFSARANRRSQERINEQQIQLARDQMQWQTEQNALNNQFSHDEAALSYQRQIDMFNRQNAYNDPSAAAQRYRAAGFNPAVVLSQSQGFGQTAANPSASAHAAASSSGVTNPSIPSLAAPQYPNVAGDMISGIVQMAQASSLISSSGLSDAQKNRINTLLTSELDKIQSETDRNKIQNDLDKSFGKLKRGAEIQLLFAQAYLASEQGKTEDEKRLSLKASRLLDDETRRLHGAQRSYQELLNQNFWNAWEEQKRNNAANRAQQYASAKQLDASTKRMLELLPHEITSAQLENGMLAIQLLESKLEHELKEEQKEQIKKLMQDRIELLQRQYDIDLHNPLVYLEMAVKPVARTIGLAWAGATDTEYSSSSVLGSGAEPKTRKHGSWRAVFGGR